MTRSHLSRVVTLTAAVALVGGTAAAVASAPAAVGAASAAECRNTASDTKKDASTVGATHSYTKSVPSTAGAGTSVTYQITVGTSGGNSYVNSITDVPPAGFGKPTAKVRAWHLGVPSGMRNETVQVTAGPDGSWRVGSSGWSVKSGQPVIASFTYQVPSKLGVGTKVTSGGLSAGGTIGVKESFPDLGVCFTTRVPNPVEGAGSVADGLGLGSSEGSVEDLTGDIVGGVVRGLIGGATGS
ncbi:MAG: hypothetical protein WBA05_00395 [Gordonia sp. (in: high G+C Gram-positive bacteria)]|uniref:hypothetical protein n=1 Tax=Gordonia sp. (in: high G+C Gram-positive bacteria) TaxID=84139 RepID=UPI003C75059A